MNLINDLRSTTSRITKEIRLRDISHDEWRMFSYAYHPDSIYRMKFNGVDMQDIGEPSDAMFTLLDKILDGKIIGTEAKNRVHSFAGQHGTLIKLICNKDLDCGVTATLFNKVNPGSIPQFKVQSAKEVDIKTIDYPVLAQIKYDGVRLIAIVEDRVCTFKTRNGKIVYLPELRDQVQALPFDNYILDGEIVLDTGKQEDRTKISGMINSAMHGGVVNEQNMVLHVFDTMPLSDFNSLHCEATYEDRFSILKVILASMPEDKLRLAITNEVHSAEAATALYEGVLALGYEGLVLKYPDHKYTFKRSKDWIKVKEVKSVELEVIDIEEGEGKYSDMIGALVCQGTVEGKTVRVKVGSGLSDIQRALPVSEFMYEIVEVLYNAVIQDSITLEWSLFLPRFVQVRFDKDEL